MRPLPSGTDLPIADDFVLQYFEIVDHEDAVVAVVKIYLPEHLRFHSWVGQPCNS